MSEIQIWRSAPSLQSQIYFPRAGQLPYPTWKHASACVHFGPEIQVWRSAPSLQSQTYFRWAGHLAAPNTETRIGMRTCRTCLFRFIQIWRIAQIIPSTDQHHLVLCSETLTFIWRRFQRTPSPIKHHLCLVPKCGNLIGRRSQRVPSQPSTT